jgi:spermidine/putrescine transport system substrate-binding protein
MDQFFEMMPSGSLAVGAYYAGDCLSVMEENPDLKFVIPECGTNIFSDAMCIPKTSQKKELAEQFINFMLTERAGKANTEYVCYSTPNHIVRDSLDESISSNEIAYPIRRETWESFRDLPAETNSLITELWNEIKTNNK